MSRKVIETAFDTGSPTVEERSEEAEDDEAARSKLSVRKTLLLRLADDQMSDLRS
jgi:hypothetical protein